MQLSTVKPLLNTSAVLASTSVNPIHSRLRAPFETYRVLSHIFYGVTVALDGEVALHLTVEAPSLALSLVIMTD